MSIYTLAEIKQKIQDIDLAITNSLNHKSYELDTGQGRQKVTRQNLKDLRIQREYWVSEYDALKQNGLMRIRNLKY